MDNCLVSEETSLIVLEELDQYIKHRICPPKSLPEFRNAYLEVAAKWRDEETTKTNDKLNYVAQLWSKRSQLLADVRRRVSPNARKHIHLCSLLSDEAVETLHLLLSDFNFNNNVRHHVWS